MPASTEELIQGYSESEKTRIQELTVHHGISPEDPMFQIMVTLGRYEETMIEIPARMEAMVEAWAVLIDRKLEKTSKTTQSMHYAVVSESVREVLREELVNLETKKSPLKNLQQRNWSIWGMSAIAGAMLAAGALLGSMTTWNIVVKHVGAASIVTNDDLQLLEWAKSEDGKFARQLIKDNQSTILACQKENRLQGHCLIKVR